ncbi:phage baseplate plug family protein [Labrys neptuniae]
MPTTYEIPLSPTPKTFSIDIGNATYQLTFTYRNVTEGGWILSIADSNGNDLLNGVPLVPGVDLLAQYAYLGFGFQLWCAVDANPAAAPAFADLGVSSHVYVTVP